MNLTDQLFQRSKAFRTHLTASFTDFLDLSVGFRPERPLPGPASVATQLRERTLEVVEEWNEKFGSTYKQVCHIPVAGYLPTASGIAALQAACLSLLLTL